MPLAEGFGDEVVLLFVAFLIGIVMVLAWMSTHVDSRFLVPIIILDRERFSELIRRLRGLTAQRSEEPQQPEQRENGPASENSGNAEEEEAVEENEVESGSQGASSLTERSRGKDEPQQPSVASPVDSSSPQSQDNCVRSQTGELSTDNPSSSDINGIVEASPSAESNPVVVEQQHVLGQPGANENQGSSGRSETSEGSSSSTGVPEGHVQIRLQYVDGRQRTVSARLDGTVGEFKRTHFSTELAGHSIVRFIMSGQELRDESSTLRSYRVNDGSVIHCLITQARVEPVVTTTDSNHFEIGFLMLPLFGFLLTLLWYARIVYRSYFSGASTCSLVAISFLYVIALIGSFRSHRVNHPHQD